MSSAEVLSSFFTRIARDPRISLNHIGMYAALVQFRLEHGFDNPICAFRYELMQLAKISGKSTYHKLIKDLSDFGYIRYAPSRRRNQGSTIYFPVDLALESIK
ncbi:hypothetical protein [Adhaeribacter rhizoryzae]|uniref:Helix-turn-helix domain-containing protein n=1 Tax=Adhaeribacter rhizoryzae TaxID=2607907 RepID=A0A5M6DRU3_9BACT|nr:hypothetical protein [Adhaeribacter rhizoryzae]KAA5548125.1 hypothetical protein F0145_05195 [Adhaeribacter rhizoryzae]